MSAADLCLALALSALLSVVVAAAQYMRAEKAEAEVARLTAQWRKTGRAVISEMNRAERAEAERDALAAQVARVEEVLEHWRTVDEGNAAYAERIGERSRFADGLASRADMLRAALTGSETDTSDTQSTDQEVKS